MRAFKVVSHSRRGNLVSCAISGRNSITYVPGKWSKKHLTGPFVFRHLNDAQWYRYHIGGSQIWEVETTDDCRPLEKMVAFNFANNQPRKFLAERLKLVQMSACDAYYKEDAYPGTMIASQVRLVRRIS